MIEQDEYVDHDEELTLVPDEPTWCRYAVFIGTNHDNVSGQSDKFYEVSIEPQDDGTFLLSKRYGARPDHLNSGQTRTKTFTNMRVALGEANDVFGAKLAKGYMEVPRGY